MYHHPQKMLRKKPDVLKIINKHLKQGKKIHAILKYIFKISSYARQTIWPILSIFPSFSFQSKPGIHNT